MIESDSPPSVQFQQDDRMDRPEKNPSLNTINTISPRLHNIIDNISPRPSTDEEPEKEDSEYMLKWGAHNGELITVFDSLRQDGHLTDVTLSTEDDQFLAHQLVLSACSPYFRSLFTKSPCKHPIIFLKEVPSDHIRLLLDYMYKGCISVKQNDLEHILRTATSLKIRGLATEEAPKDAEKDKFQRIETGSNHSGRSSSSCGRREKREGGRKSSKPKRLRLSHSMSGDSGVSSPHQNWMDCYQDPERPLVISEPDTATDRSPTNGLRLVDSKSLMDTRHSSGNTSPLDSIAESEGEDQNIDPNQPVDFSKNDQLTPRFSILGNHVKSSNGRNSKTPDQGRRFDEDLKVERRFEENRKNEQSIVDSKRPELSGILTGTALEEAAARMNALAPKLDAASGLAGLNSLAAAAGWMNPLSGLGGQNPLTSLSNLLDRNQQLGQPQQRPPSRDSRMSDSDTSAEDLVKEPKKHSPTGMPPLPAVPTLDLADQLRSAMMAMQPSHLSSAHYAYLNGVGGVSSPAHTPASSLADSYAKPKNPVGGYKTGEVGPNGKQPVACEVCGKKLTDPSSLYRHRKIHSGDKPHKCPYCDRRFIQRYNMKQHIKTHKMELLADKSNWDLLPKNHDLGDLEEQHRNQAQDNWERDQRNWEVAVPGNRDVAAIMEAEDEPLNMTA